MCHGPAVTTTRRLYNMKRGKKYVEAAKKIDRAAQYEVADAVKLINS